MSPSGHLRATSVQAARRRSASFAGASLQGWTQLEAYSFLLLPFYRSILDVLTEVFLLTVASAAGLPGDLNEIAPNFFENEPDSK